LLLEKFENALSELRPGKAPAELLKAFGSRGKQELYAIGDEMHISEEWQGSDT